MNTYFQPSSDRCSLQRKGQSIIFLRLRRKWKPTIGWFSKTAFLMAAPINFMIVGRRALERSASVKLCLERTNNKLRMVWSWRAEFRVPFSVRIKMDKWLVLIHDHFPDSDQDGEMTDPNFHKTPRAPIREKQLPSAVDFRIEFEPKAPSLPPRRVL